MKKYPLIDLFRLICACLVVVIHMAPSMGGSVANMIKVCFARQAVPFFFIASGFFFAQKLTREDDKKGLVLQYTKRLLIIYGIWVLIYMPELIYDYMKLYQNESGIYFLFLLIRRVLFAGVAQFWYVLVLAETALISGCLMLYKEKWMYTISGIGFALGFIYVLEIPLPLFELYNKVVYSLFSWNYNFLMFGMPFFAIGIYFYQKKDRFVYSIKALIITYLMVSITNIICFYSELGDWINVENVISVLSFQSILLFLIGINGVCNIGSEKLFLTCRLCSGAIYCLHNLVIRYVIGNNIFRYEYFVVEYAFVILICVVVFFVVKMLRIKSLYRLITLR